jgi:hypothetical protein
MPRAPSGFAPASKLRQEKGGRLVRRPPDKTQTRAIRSLGSSLEVKFQAELKLARIEGGRRLAVVTAAA